MKRKKETFSIKDIINQDIPEIHSSNNVPKLSYLDQLKTPQWKEKRDQIMQRDNYTCQECGGKDTSLNVHHKLYIANRTAWDYHHLFLITLCESCHKKRHQRLQLIHERLGFMNNDQLYFTIDIVNMLQLASSEECLQMLESLTSLLKEKYHV
ncbi:MAG TPA: hypothetical protein VMV77_09060 [Bacteroidales bacterium]|nr:hypothetical protein [Bacteroidales bacterium]